MRRKYIFNALGFALSVIPALVATIDQFPLMTTTGQASVMAILAIVLCCVPFIKQIKAAFRSPSAWMMWGIIFLLCALTRALVDEFYAISMVAFVSSLIGALFFWLAKREEKHGRENSIV